MKKFFFLIFLTFSFLATNNFALARQIKDCIVQEDTFFYLYVNAEKVEGSKIYDSVNKSLIQKRYQGYSRLLDCAKKIKITEKDIAEIHISYSLKDVKKIADITDGNLYYLYGIVLKKEITIAGLFGVLKEALKEEHSLSVKKLKHSDNEIVQIKTQAGSIYIAVPYPKLLLMASDLKGVVALMDSYKDKNGKKKSGDIADLLSKSSLTASLYAVLVIPPILSKELQGLNSNLKLDEEEDIRYKISNCIKNLKGVTILMKTDDSLSLELNAFFETIAGATSFGQLVTQFTPLLKFQLFLMVQNGVLPLLNTIDTKVRDKAVTISAVLTADDLVSINQMIKK